MRARGGGEEGGGMGEGGWVGEGDGMGKKFPFKNFTLRGLFSTRVSHHLIYHQLKL